MAEVDEGSEVEASQASKRARTAEDSDVELNERAQPSERPKPNGQQAEDAEDDEVVEQVKPEEWEEDEFEKKHEDAIREKVFAGPKGQGVSRNLHALQPLLLKCELRV